MTAASPEPAGVEICGNCHQVRHAAALVPAEGGGWRCAEGCRHPGGRPPVGPPLLIRMPADLRASVEALREPGESLAATARRLLADAVAAAEGQGADDGKTAAGSRAEKTAPGPAAPACPDCGGPRELSLGNVAMCGQCGGIFDMAAAATVPPGYQPREAAAEIEGSRGVLAEDRAGRPVLVGPVYSAKGVAELRALIGSHPGWAVLGPVRIVSKAHLAAHGDGMWR